MSTSFHQKTIEIIKQIPKGKVATYGQIAALAGSPGAARQVVRALHTSSRKEKLPWQRVINSQGKISLKPGYGYEEQKTLLLKEGVTFSLSDIIDLKQYQWMPLEK